MIKPETAATASTPAIAESSENTVDTRTECMTNGRSENVTIDDSVPAIVDVPNNVVEETSAISVAQVLDFTTSQVPDPIFTEDSEKADNEELDIISVGTPSLPDTDARNAAIATVPEILDIADEELSSSITDISEIPTLEDHDNESE